MKKQIIWICLILFVVGACVSCVAAMEDDLYFSCYEDEECPSGMFCVDINDNYEEVCVECEISSDCGDGETCDESYTCVGSDS